jgi:glucosamine-6-phosphate deaminase
MEQRKYEKLNVRICATNTEVGEGVAAAFAEAARAALAERESIAVILATGNSQLSFAEAVVARDDIDWSRITILHMDEYIGMSADHPASFRRWMHDRIVDKVHPKGFEGVRGDHIPVAEEIARYTQVIRDLRPSITVMGIGENGHLAFNDPPADFETSDAIRIVTMDERSRRQQVGEGHFQTLDEMPLQALTLTIPALLDVDTVLVAVPELRKADAVRAALEGPVTPDCPASILRREANAHVFLDRESASKLAAQ